jgi:hypothetical protein
MACPKPCNKCPFSAFTKPLYLVFRGRWPNLAYGISGVWALGPKLASNPPGTGNNDEMKFKITQSRGPAEFI